jgi:hypothetical protein
MAIPELPEDPSDEQLARDWHLSPADRVEACRCRGDANRHRFAIQLCVLRYLGRFVDDYADVPARITNHLGRQLGLLPILLVPPPSQERRATATEYAQRIREYLGYQTYDDSTESSLSRVLVRYAASGASVAALIDAAPGTLRGWKVVPPAPGTLERLAIACAVEGEEATWRRLHSWGSEPRACGNLL